MSGKMMRPGQQKPRRDQTQPTAEMRDVELAQLREYCGRMNAAMYCILQREGRIRLSKQELESVPPQVPIAFTFDPPSGSLTLQLHRPETQPGILVPHNGPPPSGVHPRQTR